MTIVDSPGRPTGPSLPGQASAPTTAMSAINAATRSPRALTGGSARLLDLVSADVVFSIAPESRQARAAKH